jgi:MFS family permease
MSSTNTFSGGMKTFGVIWFGQTVSLLGTRMTQFALLTWAFQETNSAMTIALLGFFSFMPYIILSPLAGVWADRFDRKRIMIIADVAAGLSTVALLLLYFAGGLEVWHLYAAEMIASSAGAFHSPAFSASITTMVPKKHYGRTAGMRSLSQSVAEVGAPFIANAALAVVGVAGVMVIDLITFLFAASVLLWVRIPRPTPSAEGAAANQSRWQAYTFGFRYIAARRGLLYLLLLMMGMNFIATLTYMGVLPAMILARSGGSETALALVQGTMGLAGVIGGLLVTIWGLPKRRIHAVLAFGAISFLAGDFLFAVGRSVEVWIIAGMSAQFWVPFIMAGDRAIYQEKTAPDVQGRVFAVNGMVRTSMMPLGYLVAGLLADGVFEPAMAAGGALAEPLGWLVGVGPGAGMGLMFSMTAIMGSVLCLSGYLVPALRRVDDLPDHDAPALVGPPVLAVSPATD